MEANQKEEIIYYVARSYFITLLCLVILTPITAQGVPLEPIERPVAFDVVPITDIAIDENRPILSVIHRFPNGCYEPWNTFKEVQGDNIILNHIAVYPQEAACTRDIYFHETTFTTVDLDPGTYTLRDGNNFERLGTIKKKAQGQSLVWQD